jgi:aryl-alcohol dehydrogenase-like predicted oxidoreductase
MAFRGLGSRGPSISVIGYGGWEAGAAHWGPAPPDEVVLESMWTGFDVGMNWVDTAEMYGKGRSEELIGLAIRNRPDVMTFTKVASAPRGSGFEPENVRRAAEASLRRLGRDFIDLYQLHWLDEDDAPLEDTWGAMVNLLEDGLVRWIGVSNFTAEAIARCERIGHVDALQPHLSMLWHERLSLLPFCQANGTGVLAYGPLAFGLLTGVITKETDFDRDDWRSGSRGLRAYGQLFAPGRLEANLEVVTALGLIAERMGVTLPQLALAWVLHLEGVTGVIVGSRSADHVRANAAGVRVSLSKDDAEEIASILQRRGEVVHPVQRC